MDAALQKIITTTASTGVGHIVEPGADGVANIRFELTGADTLALGHGILYHFDIQVLTDNNKVETVEVGTIGPLIKGITDASS